MLNIVYIEDSRRPERNEKYKAIISSCSFSNVFSFCENVDVESISSLDADGVICHSGMAGYELVVHFSKIKNWPLLAYSGSISSPPYLKESSFTKNHYSVDADYFEFALPQFVEVCKVLKDSK